MDGDKRVTARWERVQPSTYTLTTTANPSGGAAGYVQIVGGSGTVPGQRDFDAGDVAWVVAHTNSGWRFAGWSGDASGGDVTKSVLMNGDKRVTARWERVQLSTYTLTTTASPGGGADRLRADRGPAAGVLRANATLARGQVAQIIAHTNSGWRFTGWTGDASGTSRQQSVTMNRHKSVTANWQRVQPTTYTLRLEATPNNGSGGYVEVHNGSGNTPGQRVFNAGDYASLEAKPESGWRFVRWEIDASGTNEWKSVLMNRDKRVRAVFERERTVTLYLRANPSSGVGGYVHVKRTAAATFLVRETSR